MKDVIKLVKNLLSTPEDFRSWLVSSDVIEYEPLMQHNPLEAYIKQHTGFEFETRITNILVQINEKQTSVYGIYDMPAWITHFMQEFVTILEDQGTVHSEACLQILDDFISEAEFNHKQ